MGKTVVISVAKNSFSEHKINDYLSMTKFTFPEVKLVQL